MAHQRSRDKRSACGSEQELLPEDDIILQLGGLLRYSNRPGR
jgi:hypothetical protein